MNRSEEISDLAECELVLTGEHVHAGLGSLTQHQAWQTALPELLQESTTLLKDALDLLRELDKADDVSDYSYVVRPSINEHSQNRNFHDWTALIDLTRDAWLATARTNPQIAMSTAEGWMQIPYPIFKRLAFFAAQNTEVVEPDLAMNWLLRDNNWWLWSIETEREVIRLLITLATQFDSETLSRLEHAILQGPPREMYSENLEPDEWYQVVDRSIWKLLAKLETTDIELSSPARTKLGELTQRYPDWQIAPDQRDEFAIWIGDVEDGQEVTVSPRRRRDLMEWLLETPDTNRFKRDDWRDRCRRDFPTTACALLGLAQRNAWPEGRWGGALQAWAEDKLLKRSWRYMAKTINQFPDNIKTETSHSLSWWIKTQAKVFDGQEEIFFSIIGDLLSLSYEERDQSNSDDIVGRAINHPIGHATEALLSWWYRQEPKEGQGLPREVKAFFTELTNIEIGQYRLGRVILAAHAISLFRVDEAWSKNYLVPLFDWNSSEEEAAAVWRGFLWSPRIYPPLISVIKPSLLQTVSHYGRLGEHRDQYVDFLTFSALDQKEIFTYREIAEVTQRLPESGLQIAAETLVRALEGAGDQHSEFWHNRILPYLKFVWPKSESVRTPQISEKFAQICLATKEEFPNALYELKHWLQPIDYSDHIVDLLNKTNLCNEFPADALYFLNALIGDDVQWLTNDLSHCLEKIRNSDESLANDPQWIRLQDLLARRGVG